jgi:hypothetical protein
MRTNTSMRVMTTSTEYKEERDGAHGHY